ncbi:MAG: hypothetical protein ABR928_20680, partial [Terracidiphilus sp.]
FAMVRNLSKWCSYQLGLHERSLPLVLKKAISGQPSFWQESRSFPILLSSYRAPGTVSDMRLVDLRGSQLSD